MNPTFTGFFSPEMLPTFACVLTRVSGMVTAAPLWSLGGVPRRVRGAIIVMVTLALLPAAPRAATPELLVLPIGLGVEFLIGLVVGLTAAVLVHGATLAGEVVALQMGLSLGEAVTPMTETLVPGVGQIKSFLALMIYVGVDGHLMLVRGLADGFHALPPGGTLVLHPDVATVGTLLGTVYAAGVRIAAPAMATLILVNLAMGITSRAVPQLPAILVLFPVAIAVGLTVIVLSLPSISGVLAGWFTDLPVRVATMLDLLRGVS